MQNEYIIVNKTAIEKRIEELEKEYILLSNKSDRSLSDIEEEREFVSEQRALAKILSQSTPLIPEIEKAFVEGQNRMQHEIIEKLGLRYQTEQVSQSTILNMEVHSEDYISNLKLNI